MTLELKKLMKVYWHGQEEKSFENNVCAVGFLLSWQKTCNLGNRLEWKKLNGLYPGWKHLFCLASLFLDILFWLETKQESSKKTALSL